MPDDYRIEKLVWDDRDFYQMGWHDVTLHAMAFGPGEFELSLDIDYIFEWVRSTEGGSLFQFRVAPCTLVFWTLSERGGLSFERRTDRVYRANDVLRADD